MRLSLSARAGAIFLLATAVLLSGAAPLLACGAGAHSRAEAMACCRQNAACGAHKAAGESCCVTKPVAPRVVAAIIAPPAGAAAPARLEAIAAARSAAAGQRATAGFFAGSPPPRPSPLRAHSLLQI